MANQVNKGISFIHFSKIIKDLHLDACFLDFKVWNFSSDVGMMDKN